MTGLSERDQVIGLVSEAMTAGARQDRACAAISLSARTMQRWQCDVQRGGLGPRGDQRPLRVQAPQNKLSELERQRRELDALRAEVALLPPVSGGAPAGAPRRAARTGVIMHVTSGTEH